MNKTMKKDTTETEEMEDLDEVGEECLMVPEGDQEEVVEVEGD